jgi:hypothetical protein
MTIFHIIKYQVTDIYDQEQLDQLPDEVIDRWVARIREHAIEQAESVVRLDESGTAQPCIDATKKYLRGEITKEELEKYRRAAWAAWTAAQAAAVAAEATSRAAGAAAEAAEAAAWTTAQAARAAARAAAVAAIWATRTVQATWTADQAAWTAARAATKELFHKWLMQELDRYEE